MYDRMGKPVVFNQTTYDIMLIMREVQPFDTLDFCKTLNLTKEQLVKRFKDVRNRRLNPGYSSYVPQVFLSQLSSREYGVLQEKMYKYPGFYMQKRVMREYIYPNGGLLLGDLGEVNKKDLEADPFYSAGDYSGRSGIERSYEKILRGEKGVEILLRDAHGRIKGRYEDGKKDIPPVAGKDLTLSIDMELQAYGESLMRNKIGSIVMIEPTTGEVLALVSAPNYDPGMLVGRKRGQNHGKLAKDPLKPLFNRPIMAYHPPGSTFKAVQGLIFLQENVITPETMYSCAMGYTYRNSKPACHPHGSPLALVDALATSCNSFFCWGLHDMLDSRKRYPSVQEAFEVWKNYVVAMGFGYTIGIDLPTEKRGFIPNSKVYDTWYNKRWNSSTIISNAIGQGEITTTPLQICNLAAQIANGGYFITPHVVKEIEDTPLDSIYTNKRYTGIDSKYYTYIQQGMRQAVWAGTCRGADMIDIEVFGKTGTAENPHGKDHSAFMGYANYKGKQVAISVMVENAGFGATYAVPIARLMIEKSLRREILEISKPIEERMHKAVVLPHMPGILHLPLD
jgi:penicillin-binding protein 2